MNLTRLPRHIAIIMDGNGRWATRRGLPRNFGHKEGVNAVMRTIKACLKYGIKYCSFFAFSTENWKRSEEEINGIFGLVRDYILKNNDFFVVNKIKVVSSGDLEPFPSDLKAAFNDLKQQTKEFDSLTVNFALNYGGRSDITRAVNEIIREKNFNGIISEEQISQHLYTKDIPDPDFVLRTSGEQRISNFMLYQMAYSELYFPKVMWPDFNEKCLLKSLKVYQKRDRRFGGIKK